MPHRAGFDLEPSERVEKSFHVGGKPALFSLRIQTRIISLFPAAAHGPSRAQNPDQMLVPLLRHGQGQRRSDGSARSGCENERITGRHRLHIDTRNGEAECESLLEGLDGGGFHIADDSLEHVVGAQPEKSEGGGQPDGQFNLAERRNGRGLSKEKDGDARSRLS